MIEKKEIDQKLAEKLKTETDLENLKEENRKLKYRIEILKREVNV